MTHPLPPIYPSELSAAACLGLEWFRSSIESVSFNLPSFGYALYESTEAGSKAAALMEENATRQKAMEIVMRILPKSMGKLFLVNCTITAAGHLTNYLGLKTIVPLLPLSPYSGFLGLIGGTLLGAASGAIRNWNLSGKTA